MFAEFAKALARGGDEVTCLSAAFPGCTREAWVDGVRVLRLGPEWGLSGAVYLAYRRWFRDRVDIVLEEFLGGSRIPFAAPLYAREPIVSVWFQDHVPLFRHQLGSSLGTVLGGLERILISVHRDDYFLVPSAASRQSLVGKGADPRRITVFHPGLGKDWLHVGPPPSAGSRTPRIVCLGKIRRYKCQHHGILVLNEILRDVPRASLVIAGRVGDESYVREMRGLAMRLGLMDRVTFELNVTEGRKRELLRTSRALLAPAPVEGFGIAILEANACGLPAIGSFGVPEDALVDGRNGFRVPFGDTAAMTRRAKTLLTDDAFFDQLAAKAQMFARQFTWERATEPLLALFRELQPKRR